MPTMTDALDGLRLGFLSCAVFASLMIIVVLHGICCNKRRRLAAAAVEGSSEEKKPDQCRSSAVAIDDSDVNPCAGVYEITGQQPLPSLVDCHKKPFIYERSLCSQITSKSTSKRQPKKNSSANNRNESPLKQKTLPQDNMQKPKSVLATIEEHEPTTAGDGKKSRRSNRDGEGHGVSGGPATDAPRPTNDDPRQLTTQAERSDSSSGAANRDSSLSTRTYNTIKTTNSYETIHSNDSGFPTSNNSRSSQYDFVIGSSSGSESCERTSSQGRWRPRESAGEEEREDEGQEVDGVFDPHYAPLFPPYCETLSPLDGTYEALKKADYPATISTTHPVTQSQQIELQNKIKADANPKRNTVSLG